MHRSTLCHGPLRELSNLRQEFDKPQIHTVGGSENFDDSRKYEEISNLPSFSLRFCISALLCRKFLVDFR